MVKMPVNWKILLVTFLIIAFSFLLGGIFVLSNILYEQEKDFEQRAMLVARTVSNMPELSTHLKNTDIKEAASNVNALVEGIRIINKAEYIVVMNIDRVKLSHPSSKEIGMPSKSMDLNAAFSEHYYISKAQGGAGVMIRAFAPVIDDTKKQVGIVIVGYPVPTFMKMIESYGHEILITVLMSLIFSVWGAYTLGKHIKKQMFGLEPHEIAKMYVERTETFNAMHEGIIAVDKTMNITIFNEKAGDILGVGTKMENYIGKKIYDVLPDTRLPEIVETGTAIYNQELYINHHSILSNRVPISVNGEIVGAVAMFKDLTEVKKLAEEVTGVKAFVQALRVQTHEHKNKLHTIAGLLQLGHTRQALEYVTTATESEASLTKFLNERFHNENISGLLLSKVSYGKELGIQLEIDRKSHFKRFPALLDHHDFVVLFGNLIENAFEALNVISKEDKYVSISVDEHDGILAIAVSDNGIGMSEEVRARMFENGFSTKESENRGIGLYLIHEIVTKGHGEIEVTSEFMEGTSFLLLFELGENNDGDNTRITH
ncbi:ATP-binding protein [Lysinibacillus sp. NPDC097287]|uniref:ATP-binding protein n=1 Tax=Lysinibacillus sp. NPDC097287 TaxID=3364144 RepID=UPI0038067329